MNVSINSKELIKLLEFTPAEHNIMLAGRHGIGKSEILSNYYKTRGFDVVTPFRGLLPSSIGGE